MTTSLHISGAADIVSLNHAALDASAAASSHDISGMHADTSAHATAAAHDFAATVPSFAPSSAPAPSTRR